MIFVLLHFYLNECSLQHTKNATSKMSDTYINSQPKPFRLGFTVITFGNTQNLAWGLNCHTIRRSVDRSGVSQVSQNW
jgi:hypothetical protein